MTRTGIINAAFSAPWLKRDRAVYLSLLMVVLRVIMPALFIFMFYKLYLPENSAKPSATCPYTI